jgi:uncharacterized membrane protein
LQYQNKYKEYMKKLGFLLSIAVVLAVFSSCASKGLYRPLTKSEKGVTAIGSVQCNFCSMTYLGAGRIAKANQEQAYIELMKQAKETYVGSIDVRNVVVAYVGLKDNGPAVNNEFTASGIVVLLDSNRE